eukprot:jgi/Mesvir1/27561/Mv07311-RA.1
MDFSEAHKLSGPCDWSPNGRYLATVVDYRLVIREVDSLQVIQIFSCLDKIEHIEWSPDSSMILCCLYSRSIVQAWSVDQPDWTCKIDEGPAGLMYARWSPDARHILTCAEFAIKVTVWSLVSKKCVYIRCPKAADGPNRGLDFSHDGSFMALAERRDCKDYIIIYGTDTWEVMSHFKSDSVDLVDLSWAPDDSCIAVWDSVLEYRILVYSPDGKLMTKFQAYDNALGAKSLSWCPSGQLLAVGSYDQFVRVLNDVTWKPYAEFPHAVTVKSPDAPIIYKEVLGPEADAASGAVISDGLPLPQDAGGNKPSNNSNNGGQGNNGNNASSQGGKGGADTSGGNADGKPGKKGAEEEGMMPPAGVRACYVVCDLPFNVPNVKALPDKPNPKLGVGLLLWSADNHYLATRNDNMPCVLWIWDMTKIALAAVLVQAEPIKSAQWDPRQPCIAVCCGGPRVFVWTPEGASCVHIPLGRFNAHSLKWNPSGAAFLLADRQSFCCAFLPA